MSTLELTIGYHDGAMKPGEINVDFPAIMKDLIDSLPSEGVTIAMHDLAKQGYSADTTLVGEGLANFVREMLDAEDYALLGKTPPDVPMLTYGQLYQIGKPIPIGGGGTAIQYIVELVNSDKTVVVAVIAALTSVIHKIIELYAGRNQSKQITLKEGDIEIHLSGYSTEAAKKAAEDFISTRLGNQIVKEQENDSGPQSV